MGFCSYSPSITLLSHQGHMKDIYVGRKNIAEIPQGECFSVGLTWFTEIGGGGGGGGVSKGNGNNDTRFFSSEEFHYIL